MIVLGLERRHEWIEFFGWRTHPGGCGLALGIFPSGFPGFHATEARWKFFWLSLGEIRRGSNASGVQAQ